MVFISLLFSALAIGAVEIHDEKIAFPDSPHHTIFLSNHYVDQLTPIEICVYLYTDLSKNRCQAITKEHPAFLLQSNRTWSQIQRVVLRGKRVDNPTETLSCIAYQGHHADTLASLERVGNSTIQVNYVGDHYMVCSLF